ncbi:MAG: glycosyltransferase [Ferruginibacter sp.]
MEQSKQVFQTPDSKRWKRVKWTSRVIIFLFIFLISVLVLALVRGALPSIPNLTLLSKVYETKLDPSHPFTFSYSKNRKIKGFKDFLERKEKVESGTNLQSNSPAYIRAGFYTPWTSRTSLPVLGKYGDSLNTIFAEWFFIDTNTMHLQTRIDSAGLATMRRKNLQIIPMLTNFNSSKKDFDGDLLHILLNDKTKQAAFIKQLADTLSFYHFAGINIDFEELKEKTTSPLTSFQQSLYNTLHPLGFQVSIDVEPRNNDYDFKSLSVFNDYLVLMAYDEFNGSKGPGPISSQKWIEDNLDWLADKVPAHQIILGIGAYGYDWASDGTTTALTFTDAINKARELSATIIYDNDSYNLHYNYSIDEPGQHGETNTIKHQVWFIDAATVFNILRFNDEYPTAGTAIWRLGSEDERIWSFYNRNLSNASIAKNPFDFNLLKTIPASPTVGFTGEGEVLNVLYSPQKGSIELDIDSTEKLIAEQHYIQLPSGYIIQKFAEDTTEGRGHKLILTFDDGPSEKYTPLILDILEKEKIPASFFIVGLQAQKNIPLLQRIYKDGFEIGNHTFTHSNIANMSLQRANIEMKLTRLLIECITGHSTILFRAPYNADSEPQTFEELEPIARSKTENYFTIGESIDPMDWEPQAKSDSIFARVVKQVEERNASIILLHDAGGESRQATVDALPKIIRYFKNKGYVFTTIADLMGKTKADVMPEMPATSDNWVMNINFFFAESSYWITQVIFSLFIIGIVLSVSRMFIMAVLALIQNKREQAALLNKNQYPVTVIIPAYNEEVNICRTIKSILNQQYAYIEILVVDDGSKDDTYLIAKETFATHKNITVLKKANGGKATALNYGISMASHEFVICIDGDTQLKSDAVSELMQRFDEEAKVGAVAGNVKVGNEINMITRWQSIEYITSQNFDRRAFDLLNCITVVPGAIGAFRKAAVLEAGGFTTDTLAEDCDLTMRLHRNHYQVRNCNKAISYTEAPETLSQFLKQRFRWNFGVMQSFWKHKEAFLNPRYKNFGMIAMPNILMFQVILPLLAPLADLVLILSLLAAAAGIVPASLNHIVFYYCVFSLVDVAGAAFAFSFEKADYKKLLWLIPQRFIYRQVMYYIAMRSFRMAIKGELQGWGVLKRTGSVQMQEVV